MAKRAKRKAKKTVKRRTVAPKPASRAKAAATNRKAQWTAYKALQARVDKAWEKLKADVKKKAKPQVLIQGKNHLLLLLGECNYMASEALRLGAKKRKRH